jgi:hypothetical protein
MLSRFWGSGASAKWALVAVGLLTTSCAGAIGAGAAVVVVGAGLLSFRCYDRVSVTVTDGLTGTKLCDAKVTFFEGNSETVATSCYQAALTAGQYTMRVERQGLQTFEEPVEVSKSGKCGQTVQTMYVALDRLNRAPAPQQITPAPVAAPPPAGTTPPAAPAPAPTPAPPAAPPTAAPPTSGTSASPSAPLPPPPPAPPPAPAASAFPPAP